MIKNFSLKEPVDIYQVENTFYLKSHPTRINKLLAHYELYKSITHLPGCVIECGVYKGASLSRFATFRNVLENDFSRKVIGFDAYGDFPLDNIGSTDDKDFIAKFENAGGNGISKEELEFIFAEKRFQNISLVKGNVFETVPEYLEKNKHTKIALLHLDLDVYEPTKFCIEAFLPHMIKGGIIVFDDYNSVEGATRAADELCKYTNQGLEKLPFYEVPAFYKIA
ncbi:MAG: class I SAM-dependent methyltransferase [Betaproteobacteria bacterium]